MKRFINNAKKYGIKYAVLMITWLVLNSLYDTLKPVLGYKASKKLFVKINRLEDILNKYDKHLQAPEDWDKYESTCIGHWSCDCCPNRCGCAELDIW